MTAALLALVLSADGVSFDRYLSQVAQGSPQLRTQRALVSQADAQVVMARVFPEPTISGGLASFDVSFVGAQNNAAASLSQPLEWPGKRAARIDAASAARDAALKDLEDTARTVRAAAALAWIDAVSAQRIAQRQRAALDTLQQLVSLNERRLKEGAGSELAVLQARVEARRLEGDVVTTEALARGLRVALEALAGRAVQPDEALAPLLLELPQGPRTVDVASLLESALSHRADVLARRRAVEAAQKLVQLARASAVPDVTVGLGWLYYTEGKAGSAYQGPPYHTVSAMLSLPLPVTGRVGAELKTAQAQLDGAEATRDAVELQVRADVQAAVLRYDAARARLELFDDSVLADGERLLSMARTSYAEGRAQLFELLSAQRSWSDLQLAAEAARAESARATITLEAAAGTLTPP